MAAALQRRAAPRLPEGLRPLLLRTSTLDHNSERAFKSLYGTAQHRGMMIVAGLTVRKLYCHFKLIPADVATVQVAVNRPFSVS